MSHNKWDDVDKQYQNSIYSDDSYYQHIRRKHGAPVNMDGFENGQGMSRTERYFQEKAAQTDPYNNLSGKTIKSLSATRQQQIHDMASRVSNSPRANLGEAHGVKTRSLIREAERQNAEGIVKNATFGQTAPVNISGQGNTTHIAPDIYSPLFLTQNLQLPRDRITANAWNRAYYTTNPYVRNAINLHATYPISKLNIKCEDKKVEQFFMDMMEKIDLLNVVQQASLEYWKLGEAFVYSNFDESTGTWDKVYLHNPDYISVKASAIPGVTTISLRPDPELQKIITSSDPAYAKIREQLDPRVIHHVLQGEYIPLDGFNISHLKHLSSPYDVRGTSIIVSTWKDLMLHDKLKECYDVDTEVLTENGFKKFDEILSLPADDPNGDPVIASGTKIACFNSETEGLEYHEPNGAVLYKYKGKMIHFNGEKADIKVTPNHKMLVQKKGKKGWGEWHDLYAGDIKKGSFYRFRTQARWSGKTDELVSFAGKKMSTILFMKFLGYVVSEGCVYHNAARYDSKVCISQLPTQPCYDDMRDVFLNVADIYGRKLSEKVIVQGSGYSALAPKEIWKASICHKELVSELKTHIGADGKTDSFSKRLPRWVMNFDSRYLKVLLDALVSGDGSTIESKYGAKEKAYRYSTVSKTLCDDVYEVAYKCGFTPTIHSTQRKDRDFVEYTVMWSETNYGNMPMVYGNPNHWGANIDEVDYDDYVWCFDVPTGYFITRRNGKITIQHNCKFIQADGMVNPLTLVKVGSSNPDGHYPRPEDLQAWREIIEQAQYDKDFKIVTHPDVSIERVGFSGSVLDTNADFQLIIDNILMGLMVPKAIITQEGATYASASVALDVMRQRYNNFRNMMANWLKQKIFAPIAEVQDFYRYEEGVKRLIIPDVEWNHMTLYDLDSYIGHLMSLYDKDPRAVSKATLYRSLGLNVKDEEANIREESFSEAIYQKEKAELANRSLSDLRGLDPEKPLVENVEDDAELPGVPGPDLGGGLPDLGGPPPGPPLGGPPPAAPDLGGGGDEGGSIPDLDLPPLDLGE